MLFCCRNTGRVNICKGWRDSIFNAGLAQKSMPANFVHLKEMCLRYAGAGAGAGAGAVAACSTAQQRVQCCLESDWLLSALCPCCLAPAVARSLQMDLQFYPEGVYELSVQNS